MTTYQEILENIRSNKGSYSNEYNGITYINKGMMRINQDGSTKHFNTYEKMARNINKWMKTGN